MRFPGRIRPGFILSLAGRFMFGRDEGSGGRSFRRIRGGIIGISLSLIPLVVVFVVANGMISGITLRYLETGTYHVQVAARAQADLEDLRALGERISGLQGVTTVWPEVQGLALLGGGLGHSGVQVRGIDPDMYRNDPGFSRYMEVTGGEFDLDGERGILVGDHLARSLGLNIGDQVRLITARTAETERFLPRVSRFTVRGLVSSGYRELDALWVFISVDDALRVLPRTEAREIVGIKTLNPFALDPQADTLGFVVTDSPGPGRESGSSESDLPGSGSPGSEARDSLLSSIRGLVDSDWRVYSWFDLERSQYMSFITTRNLLFFIMVLIVLVAAVNISAAMIMLVLEKQEEIAMLKTMGIRGWELLLIFLIIGGITGALGSLIGLTLGAIAAYNINGIVRLVEALINGFGFIISRIFSSRESWVEFELFNPDFYLSSIPVNLSIGDLVLMATVSIALSLLMSLLPAKRALRLNPLDLLHRH